MKNTIEILLTLFIVNCSSLIAQNSNYVVNVELASTTQLEWKVPGDYSAYDSLHFVVKPCTTSSSCGQLIKRNCTVSYSNPYTTVVCSLYAADTYGFNAAKYYFSIYAYGSDTVAVRTGVFNLQLNGQTPADGIATSTPYYTVALDTPLANPTFLMGADSTNTWYRRTKAQFYTDLGISDSITINGTDSAAVSGLINDTSDVLRAEWQGDINDSLNSYLQVGDWSAIEDPLVLNTDWILFQPYGESAVSSVSVLDLLALGMDTATVNSLVSTTLGAASLDILPSVANTYDLGSSSKPWDYIYGRHYKVGGSISGTGSGVYYFDFDTMYVRSQAGNSGGGRLSTYWLTVRGYVSSNLSPQTTSTYSLGSSSYKWNNAYINKIYTPKTTTGGILTPSISDSTLAIWTTEAITIDSIWVIPDDSVTIQGKFGSLGYGTNLFSSAQLVITKTTLSTFNDNTVPINNVMEFYFTALGDAVTKVYWIIFYRN